jgi:hypothetical protein
MKPAYLRDGQRALPGEELRHPSVATHEHAEVRIEELIDFGDRCRVFLDVPKHVYHGASGAARTESHTASANFAR